MKKKLAALGLAVSMMAGSVMPVYADVKVEGVSTADTSHTGDISAPAGEPALEVLPDIVVYEIQTSGGGSIAGYNEDKNPTKTQSEIDDIKKAVAKQINYIIRTEKNDNASMNLEGTRKISGYDTARMDESIVVRVNTASGYEVSGVSGGKAVAVKNADGSWTLTVPDGGGVDINVALQQIAQAEQKKEEVVTINPNNGQSAKAEWSRNARGDSSSDSGTSGNGNDFVNGNWSTDPASGAVNFTFNGTQAVSQWILTNIPGTSQAAWYYFDASGAMLTGWQKIRNANGKTCWYYLDPREGSRKGACLVNTTTPDGYTVNADGAWTENGVVQEVSE